MGISGNPVVYLLAVALAAASFGASEQLSSQDLTPLLLISPRKGEQQ
jgi:hypothetical protein